MNLPNGAFVAVVDGEKLNLFRNTGHLLDIQLQSVEAPEIPERLSGAPGRRSSEANPDNDTASPWAWPRR